VLTSTVFASLIAAAATIVSTYNLALADSKASFQQRTQFPTESAFPSGSVAIMSYVNKIGSGSSSSSILASSSTAKDPYEHISSDINRLQPSDVSPLASRTNTKNVDASAITTANTGTIQPMTITREPSHAQRQQQNPTSSQVVTPRSPSQVTIMTVSLGGQISCKPTEMLLNGKCILHPPTCAPIGLSQDSKCSPRPSYSHHILMLTQYIKSFWHRRY
jgi:hypothetical protein